jgi:hypothetical protein
VSSISVPAGQITSAGIDLYNATATFRNEAASGADVGAAANNVAGASVLAAAKAIEYIETKLEAESGLVPGMSVLAAGISMVNLSKAIADMQNAATEEQRISATLAVISAAGGVLASIPLPVTAAIGEGHLVGGALAKEAYDKNKTVRDAVSHLDDGYGEIVNSKFPSRRKSALKAKSQKNADPLVRTIRYYSDPLARRCLGFAQENSLEL